MARLLAAAEEEGLARGLESRRSVPEMMAWLDPDGAGLIGADRARAIVFNVFVPFLGDAAWRQTADGPAPRRPARTAALGATNVRTYFGALRRLKSDMFSLAPPPGGC